MQVKGFLPQSFFALFGSGRMRRLRLLWEDPVREGCGLGLMGAPGRPVSQAPCFDPDRRRPTWPNALATVAVRSLLRAAPT